MSPPPARTGRVPWLRPALVVVLALLAVAASTDIAVPGLRAVALLLFLVLAPGLALVGFLEIEDHWRETALVIGVSLAVDLLVATAFAYYGARPADYTLGALVVLAMLGAGVQAARSAVRWRLRSPAR